MESFYAMKDMADGIIMQKERIIWLDVARSIAIISITLNHAINRSFNTSSNQMAEYLSIPISLTIFKTIIYVLSRIGVPLFVMISGVLLLSKDYEENPFYFIKHNWLNLFITTEVWLTVMFWYKQFLPGSILLSDGIFVCLIRFIMTLLFLDPVDMGSMWYMYMILCVYLVIPIISVGLKYIDKKYFLLPGLIVIIGSFLVPDISGFLNSVGVSMSFTFSLASKHVFSMYVVYLLLGYYLVHFKGLQRIKTKTIVCFCINSFLAYCIFQFWFYTREYDFVVGYNSIFPLIVSVSLFEILQRLKYGGLFQSITFILSRISFGIYFIHICIMEGMMSVINYFGLNITYLCRFLLLELVSFFGAVLIIIALDKSKWINHIDKNKLIKRYFLGIK